MRGDRDGLRGERKFFWLGALLVLGSAGLAVALVIYLVHLAVS
jgi:hypothetical protein